MQRSWFIVSLCALLLFLTAPAFSNESPPSAPAPKTAAGKTQIITDEKNNTVRVLISGREVLTIDADGLHVNGDVDYWGVLTDTNGESGQASPGRAAAAKDAKPQIVTDEKTNAVRILIGGKDVVTIDAKGLHVHGDVDHSGVITAR